MCVLLFWPSHRDVRPFNTHLSLKVRVCRCRLWFKLRSEDSSSSPYLQASLVPWARAFMVDTPPRVPHQKSVMPNPSNPKPSNYVHTCDHLPLAVFDVHAGHRHAVPHGSIAWGIALTCLLGIVGYLVPSSPTLPHPRLRTASEFTEAQPWGERLNEPLPPPG